MYVMINKKNTNLSDFCTFYDPRLFTHDTRQIETLHRMWTTNGKCQSVHTSNRVFKKSIEMEYLKICVLVTRLCLI